MDDASSYWAPLIELVPQLRCWTRLAWRDGASTEEGPWGTLFIMPTPGYLEASGGPVPLQDVEWIDISTLRPRGGMAGRPLQMTNVKDEILAALQDAPLNWELRESVWSMDRIFEQEPVQLLRFANPFGPEPRPLTD